MSKFFFLFFFFYFLSNLTGAPPKWIDIPRDDYKNIAPFLDARLEKLNELAADYHEISKISKECLAQRIEAIQRIIIYLENWLDSELPYHHSFFLSNICAIAKNKILHLKELEQLYQKGWYRAEYLKNYHFDVSELQEGYSPIFLCNKRMYDSFNGQYWGEYWMETIDPCHRQLTPYYELFTYIHGANESLLTFFLWLEEQNLSKDVPFLRFLSDQEIDQATVLVKDGVLYLNKEGENYLINYLDDSSEYIFNINLDKKLLLIPATKTIHHVSLSRGKPVLGCGNMTVKDGVIQSIELESGHYLPSVKHGVQLIKILKEIGIFISDNTRFSYYHNYKKHHTNVGEFLRMELAGE